MKVDYYSLQAELCRKSYWHFVQTFWHTVSREKLVANWHLPYLCSDIETSCRRVFARLPKLQDTVVNISPGTSKSTIFSIFMLPWAWASNPEIRFIGASFTEALAFELSGKSRQVVNSELYQRLFPHVKIRTDTNNKGHWSNTLGGDRYAVGVGGDVIGRHAHIIVIDDPLNPQGARSKADIEKAKIWCKETIVSRKVDKDVAWTALVMQRLGVDDPTALYLERGDCKHICLPGEITPEAEVKPEECKAFYKDNLFDPVRLSKPTLLKMENELGQFGYAGQIIQRPVPLGGGMFKEDRITQHEVAPPDDDFVKIIRAWDKAGSANGGDWTVGVKMGLHKNGSFWVLDIQRGQWSSEVREQKIQETAQRDGKKVRIVLEREPGSSGLTDVQQTIRRLAGYVVYAEPATGSKELRADTYSVQVNAGNVHIIKGHYVKVYFEEMQHFPNSKHDDQIDASSLAFAFLTNKKTKLGVLR